MEEQQQQSQEKLFSVSNVLITNAATIVVYCDGIRQLFLFDINGRLLMTRFIDSSINTMLATLDGQFLITGGTSLVVRQMHNLQKIRGFKTESEVTALSFSDRQAFLFVGLKSAKVQILAPSL